MSDIAALLEHCAGLGARPCLLDGGRELAYAQLPAAVAEWEARLPAAVAPGSVVALLGDFSLENVGVFLALVKRGAIVAPIASVVPSEITERLEIAQADLVLRAGADGGLDARPGPAGPKHELMRELASRGQSGLILFSSGSTGTPKAMLHELSRLLSSYTFKSGGHAWRILLFLLFDHIGGMDILLRGLCGGSTLVVPHGRQPREVAAIIERHHVEVLPASPTFLNLLLLAEAHRQFDLGSLRIIGYGAEPMPEPLLRRLRETFPRLELQQKFGTSETNAVRVRSRGDGSLFMKMDDPAVEMRIEDGELWLRSQARIRGYLNAPMTRFTDDGWFRTGDLVESDAEGFFRIIGRVQEVINVGGEKVLPPEVENVILQHPAVADCVVFGEPSAVTGQIVCAEVVPVDPSAGGVALRQALRAHCRAALEPYKVPAKILVVDKLCVSDRFKKTRLQPAPASGQS